MFITMNVNVFFKWNHRKWFQVSVGTSDVESDILFFTWMATIAGILFKGRFWLSEPTFITRFLPYVLLWCLSQSHIPWSGSQPFSCYYARNGTAIWNEFVVHFWISWWPCGKIALQSHFNVTVLYRAHTVSFLRATFSFRYSIWAPNTNAILCGYPTRQPKDSSMSEH